MKMARHPRIKQYLEMDYEKRTEYLWSHYGELILALEFQKKQVMNWIKEDVMVERRSGRDSDAAMIKGKGGHSDPTLKAVLRDEEIDEAVNGLDLSSLGNVIQKDYDDELKTINDVYRECEVFRDFLGTFPEQERQIVKGCVLEGRRPGEYADSLNVGRNSMYCLLSKCKKDAVQGVSVQLEALGARLREKSPLSRAFVG